MSAPTVFASLRAPIERLQPLRPDLLVRVESVSFQWTESMTPWIATPVSLARLHQLVEVAGARAVDLDAREPALLRQVQAGEVVRP